MGKERWEQLEKQAIQLKRTAKTLKNLGDYLKDFPREGYFVDNISKKEIAISECQPPRLRRYIKLMDNFIYLVSSDADRKKLQAKRKELEDELIRKM